MLPPGAHGELRGLLRRIPKPASDAELEIASNYYFGTPLHLERLMLGAYTVAEDFGSYDPFSGNYDAHEVFWAWACGPLTCGGTAGKSYGQFRYGHRHGRRLERWILSRRRDGSSSVRPAFAKVSRAGDGLGENTLNRCRGVL